MTATIEPAGLPPGPLTVVGAASFWPVEPRPVKPVVLELVALELDGTARHREASRLRGEDGLVTTCPFPFAVRPADLLRRRPPAS